MSTESTALAIVNEQPQTMSTGYTQDDLDALRRTIAKDCNEAQFKVFVAAFRRLGLDPFARQIVPIVQGDRMTPQTTIDGFRLIAERTRKYAGQLGPFWCGEDGVWREVWTADGNPIAARVGVIRTDFAQPLYDVAHMRSYKKSNSPTWNQLPIEMLAKVAEARALRRAFPQELSGVYTDDELAPEEPAQRHTVAHVEPTPIRTVTTPAQRTVSADPTPTTAAPVEKKSTDLRLLGAQLGWTVQEYANEAARYIGKTKDFTDDDRDRWEAHLHELLEQKRQAEAPKPGKTTARKIVQAPTVVKTTVVEDEPNFSLPVDDEPLTPDEEAPFGLRDAPVQQGA